MPLPEFKQMMDEVKREVREIPSETLHRMKDAGEDFALIDVREPDEVQKGTIHGAVAIPRGILEMNVEKVTTDKDRKIVLYCAGGNRSALAAQALQRLGFRNVLSLAGGYGGWKESGPR